MRMTLATAVLMAFGATTALAGELEGRIAPVVQIEGSQLSQPPRLSPIPVQHGHWHFVGCVRSHDGCRHAAHDRGFHHFRVSRDHHTCHHEPHLACFGR